MTPRSFERGVRDDLRARRWLRLHATLIALLTGAVAWASTRLWGLAGVEALSLRHALAFAAAYASLMLWLYLWGRWLLSRDDGGDIPDPSGGGGGGGGGSGQGAACKADPVGLKSGGGGDFAGGGSGGSFDGSGGVAESVGEAAGSALEVLGAADEAAVVLLPLALVVGVALALSAMFGTVIFGLFGVEVLLGVAVEIAFGAIGGAFAYKAQREGWLRYALRRTAWPAALVFALWVAAGAAVDHWVPQADSFSQALRLLWSSHVGH